MRTLALISIVCLAPFCRASYELVLVADQGAGATAARIHRFEGTSGAYLGSFGAGRMTTGAFGLYGVVADPTRGVCYVADSGQGVTRWNYSTGEYLGNLNIGSNYALPSLSIAPDGTLFAVSGSTISRWDPNTSTTTNVSVVGPTVLASIAIISNTEAVAVDYSQNKYYRVNPRTGAILSTVVGTVPTDGNYSASTFGRTAAGLPNVIRAAYNGGTADAYYDLFNAGFTSVTTTSATLTTVKNITGATSAHNGYYVTGQLKSNTAVGTITYITENRIELNTFGSGQLVKPYGIACINAPEPSTWAALGLGAMVLLRRRKR